MLSLANVLAWIGLLGLGYSIGRYVEFKQSGRPPLMLDSDRFKTLAVNYATAAIMFALVVGVLISCGVVLVRFVLPMAR